MSRFAVLLVGSVLMLIVAACDMDDDADDTNGTTDDTTELPTESSDNDDSDVVVPEDDDAESDEPDGDSATPGDDEAIDPDDEEALDPDAMQPGPEEGMFFDLSFDEAQDLTSFELREPEDVPEGVEFQTIMGMASPEATEEERSEEATTVTIAYMQAAADETQQGLPVELTQTIEMDMSEGLPPEAEQNQITIGDREVTHVEMMAQTGDEIVAYLWQDGEVYFSLAAILGPELEESELEDMVASVPAS